MIAEQARDAGKPDDGGAWAWLVEVDSGDAFALADKDEIAIGRLDLHHGICPDVDLTPYDPQRYISRKHARIRRESDGSFWVIDEKGTMNGTYVNGIRIPAGKPTPIFFGDFLVFGLVGLRFQQVPVVAIAKKRAVVTSDSQTTQDAGAAQRPRFAFGLNENIEVNGRVYHTQTEDLGWEHRQILTVVYSSGSIVFTRKTPYTFFWDRHNTEFTPAEMVRFQHRGIIAGVRKGKLVQQSA